MAWETVIKRGSGQFNSVPILGVRRHGISFNRVAVSTMGLEPKDGIELLYDKEKGFVGIRKIKDPKSSDFSVKRYNNNVPGGSCFVSSSAFCKTLRNGHYGAFELKFNKAEDVWYVDLTDQFVPV